MDKKKILLSDKMYCFLERSGEISFKQRQRLLSRYIFHTRRIAKRSKISLHIYTAANTDLRYLKFTILHELTHYFQWYFLQDETRTDRSLEIEANRYAYWLLNEYESNEA